LCGGHTEITSSTDRPILVGQMIGEVEAARLVRKDRIQIGDHILLTSGVAIEGTAILARERSRILRGRVDADTLARAERFLIMPGISVVRAALIVAEAGDVVHAMHDPTEGGLATGLSELVASSGFGMRVQRERIHVLPETEAISTALGLDPLNLLASGALLIVVAPDGTHELMAGLHSKSIDVAMIGEIRPASEGLTISEGGRLMPLKVRDRDEIARVSGRGLTMKRN
jgi:hydrogenase maturation factor